MANKTDACRNITKASDKAKCKDTQKMKMPVVIAIFIGGGVLILMPFIFWFILNWIIPLIGIFVIIMGLLLVFDVIPVFSITNQNSGRKNG